MSYGLSYTRTGWDGMGWARGRYIQLGQYNPRIDPVPFAFNRVWDSESRIHWASIWRIIIIHAHEHGKRDWDWGRDRDRTREGVRSLLSIDEGKWVIAVAVGLGTPQEISLWPLWQCKWSCSVALCNPNELFFLFVADVDDESQYQSKSRPFPRSQDYSGHKGERSAEDKEVTRCLPRMENRILCQ